MPYSINTSSTMMFLYIFIPLALITFGLLPFLCFYMTPFKKVPLLKGEDGSFELSKINEAGISSFKESEGKYLIKRAEGVSKVSLLLIFKRGALAIRKRYDLEFNEDVITLAKAEKGELIKIYVTKVDGVAKNSKYASGVSIWFLIINLVAQLLTTAGFAFVYAYAADSALFEAYGYWTDVAINFYIQPLIIGAVIPLVFFALELLVLKLNAPAKEVK